MSAPPFKPLKLNALDAEDLCVLSSCVQDSILKIGDIHWLAREKRFLVTLNRFLWECADDGASYYHRCQSVLHFARVQAVQSVNIPREDHNAALELLAMRFDETESPGGHIFFDFAGGGVLRLQVECIEACLTDVGTPWTTRLKPTHQVSENGSSP